MNIRILILIMFASSASALAQDIQIDTTELKIKNRYVPTGLRVGTDMISLVKTLRQDNFSGWEYNADIDIHRYILSADYGSWSRNMGDDSTTYKNDGKYWRVGIDVNFLTRDPDRNVFFLGMRYARSKYSEQMNVTALDTSWGVFNQSYENSNLSARWLELTAGLKVKIYKFIWFGYTGSLKMGLKQNKDAEMLSYDIPGYGSTARENTFGFTYQLFFRIPFRKIVPILPPKKK